MSKDYICNNHDKIIKLAEQIERYRENDFNNARDFLDEVQSIAWDIRTLAEECKEQGISMENRLADYRSTIEGLGFSRIEK
jgi:hypothetical protein